jgi:ABC-type phosphate/phosphonate transport system ATPase subunit
VLELSNPAPGSILIVGNAGSGKTRLISSILASASLLNSTEQVIYHLIAQNPQEHDAVTRSIHCREVLSAEDIAAWDLIDKLAFMAEQRRKNNREDPTILLMIDDIDYLVQFMDRDIYLRLYWLIRHGPISRIWTIATLQTNFIDKQDMRFLTAFRTLIAGQTTLRNIKNGLFTERLSNLPDLTAGSEFYLPMEGVGVVFRIGDL